MHIATAGQRGDKIFYGWWVVLAAGVGLLLGAGPILGFTFGVFLKQLSQEFGWSRSQISLAFSLSQLPLSGAVLLCGRLVDRFGARKVILPSVFLFGLGVSTFYFLSAHLWHFYALYLLLGVVSSGTMPVPYSKVIAQWFDQKRGLALGLAAAASALGAFIMPSLAQAFITLVGWRGAYVLLGLLAVGVTLPVVGFFLKETPQMLGLVPDGETGSGTQTAKASDQAPGLTCREAWRTGAFWLMISAFFLMSVSLAGCLIHLGPMLTDRGFSAQSAALATSLFGGGILLGRVGAGYALDRFRAAHVAVCFFCSTTLGIFLLWNGVTGGLQQISLGCDFIATMLKPAADILRAKSEQRFG